MKNWEQYLDDFGCRILEAVEGTSYLSGQYNPITQALKNDPEFVAKYQDMPGFNRKALSRVATVCQIAVFDTQNGPERDGKCKALRRHWYSWYKQFAQHLSSQLGEDLQSERWGLNWNGRHSQTYAEFVDKAGLTYKDLWVEDASRMIERFWDKLFSTCHIVIAVEKDSLFADFKSAAKAVGASAVFSGKGKSSKAAMEKMLRETFYWTSDGSAFDNDPLIILHISDHDFDGEAVIGPTFGKQAQRYTSNVLEARVGIRPENVTGQGHSLDDKWYQIKLSNNGYKRWAEEKAVFMASCSFCGHHWPVVGIKGIRSSGRYTCPECWRGAELINIDEDLAHGFEVEALETRDYYRLIVKALLQVLPFDYIIEKLRDECKASAYRTAETITKEILAENESYRKLQAKIEALQILTQKFEQDTKNQLERFAEPHISDWRNIEADPEPKDFEDYVHEANDWASVWRPFSQQARTDQLTEFVQREMADEIAKLKVIEIN